MMRRVPEASPTASKLVTGVAKSVTSKRRCRFCGSEVPAKSTSTWLPCWRVLIGVRGSDSRTTTRPAPSLPRRKSRLWMLRAPAVGTLATALRLPAGVVATAAAEPDSPSTTMMRLPSTRFW